MAGEQEIRGTKNLGMVQAIHVNTTPPTNKKMIWYDSNLSEQVQKIYSVVTSEWIPITGGGGGAVTNRYEFISDGGQTFTIPASFSRVILVATNGQVLSDRVYNADFANKTVTVTDVIPPLEYVIIIVEGATVSTTVQNILLEYAEEFSTSEVATVHRWIDGRIIYRQCFSGLTPNLVGDATLFTIPAATEVIKYSGFVNESINTNVRRNIDSIPAGDLERQAFYFVDGEAHYFLSNLPLDPNFVDMPYLVIAYYLKAV